MIDNNPLHGSGQAALPHPALALGKNSHAAQGIGMTDRRHRQPASDQAPHAIPKDAAILAAFGQRTVPEPPYLEPKIVVDGWFMATVVEKVSTHNRPQPLALFGET